MTLRVQALDPECTTVHRWRNFGETVARRFFDNPRVECDIGEIDRSYDRFHLSLRSGLEKRVREMIEDVAAEHLMAEEVVIEGGNLDA